MTQLACSEQKSATLIIWTKLGFIDLPIQFDEQYWCKSRMSLKSCHQGLPSFPQLFHQG
jgi:hypothetical protein